MEETTLEDSVKCTCFHCLERWAVANISDLKLVHKALGQCGCMGCVRSKDTTSCQRGAKADVGG